MISRGGKLLRAPPSIVGYHWSARKLYLESLLISSTDSSANRNPIQIGWSFIFLALANNSLWRKARTASSPNSIDMILFILFGWILCIFIQWKTIKVLCGDGRVGNGNIIVIWSEYGWKWKLFIYELWGLIDDSCLWILRTYYVMQ